MHAKYFPFVVKNEQRARNLWARKLQISNFYSIINALDKDEPTGNDLLLSYQDPSWFWEFVYVSR